MSVWQNCGSLFTGFTQNESPHHLSNFYCQNCSIDIKNHEGLCQVRRGSRGTFCCRMRRCGVSASLPLTDGLQPRMVSLFPPPYAPSLNPTEELFSSWRWKVSDQMFLCDTMNAGCLNISAEDCQDRSAVRLILSPADQRGQKVWCRCELLNAEDSVDQHCWIFISVSLLYKYI